MKKKKRTASLKQNMLVLLKKILVRLICLFTLSNVGSQKGKLNELTLKTKADLKEGPDSI